MAPAMVVGVAVYMVLTVVVMVLMVLVANNYFVTENSMIFASRAPPMSILALI